MRIFAPTPFATLRLAACAPGSHGGDSHCWPESSPTRRGRYNYSAAPWKHGPRAAKAPGFHRLIPIGVPQVQHWATSAEVSAAGIADGHPWEPNLLFLSHILLLELGIAGCSGLEQRLTEAEVACGWLLPCVILIFILRTDGMPSRQQLLRDKGGKMCIHVETPGPLPPEAFLRLIACPMSGSQLSRMVKLTACFHNVTWTSSPVSAACIASA